MSVFTSRFSYGQNVFALDRGYATRPVDCAACLNSGKVTIKELEYACPGCDGRGKQTGSVVAWHVGKSGQLAVVDCRQDASTDGEAAVKYMIESNSGRVYDECDVFETRADANREIDKRNADAIERFEARK